MRNNLAVALVLLSSLAARADVVLTVEAPGVQTSRVSGVITETFDSTAIGNYSTLSTTVGALDTPFFKFGIKLADAFGGAGGVGHYIVVGPTVGAEQADLKFGSQGAQSYVGMWISAMNPTNQIELYSGGSLIASFDAATVLASLSSAYKGNPNPQFRFEDLSEPFAYVNFIGTEGTTFDAIRFKNPPPSGGLEIDNISIRASALSEPYPGTFINGGVTSVPAPSALATAMPLVAFFLAGRKRRRW